MIIRVPDLTEEVRCIDFGEATAGLNEVLAASRCGSEQRFERDLDVSAEIYRHGSDVYVSGQIDGVVHCTCRRCLDDFDWRLHRDFRFLLVKSGQELDVDDDAGLDHYCGDEVDLGRLVREQAVLGLDETVVCSEQCLGLCSGCGANRNREPCTCAGANEPGPDA